MKNLLGASALSMSLFRRVHPAVYRNFASQASDFGDFFSRGKADSEVRTEIAEIADTQVPYAVKLARSAIIRYPDDVRWYLLGLNLVTKHAGLGLLGGVNPDLCAILSAFQKNFPDGAPNLSHEEGRYVNNLLHMNSQENTFSSDEALGIC